MTIFHNEMRPADLSNLKGLHFLPLGGCGEIGMNANLYCCDNEWLMVDNGVTFNRYPEAVLMSDIRGFVDSVDVKSQLKGLVITHAHEDHVGAVAYLLPYLRCPVYATPFTAYILRHKLKEVGIRGDCVTEIPLETRFSVGPFDVEFVTLTHSIPEPSAVVIRTPHGTVFHTGDWKIDPAPLLGSPIDHDRLQNIGDEGVLALVCDSTNVFEPGMSGSEHDVKIMLHRLVSHCSGKVILSCFSSNLARVKSAYDAAVAAGRKVCVVGRSLQRMVEAAYHCGYFDHKNVYFTPLQEINDYPAHEILIMTTGSQAEPMAALTRMSHGKHPVLTIDEGDTVIFSSRVIPGNQEAISELQNRLIRMGVTLIIRDEDVKKMITKALEESPDIADGKDPETLLEETETCWGELHVSGHPCRDELEQIYKRLRPRIIVPVHGQDVHIKEQASFALSLGIPYAIRPGNGQLFRLTSSGAFFEGVVPSGRLAMDGRRLIEVDGPVITQRQLLSERGILDIVLLIVRHHNRVREKLVSHGVFEHEKERKDWSETVRALISAEFAAHVSERDNQAQHAKSGSFSEAEMEEVDAEFASQAPALLQGRGKRARQEAAPGSGAPLRELGPKVLIGKCFALQKTIQEAFRAKWGKSPLIKVSFMMA